MKFAVIDMGTNTFNLLIVKSKGKECTIERDRKIPVKLGEGGITNKTILPEAKVRAFEALEEYQKECTEYQCDQVFAFATSAFRTAKNGRDILNQIYDELKLSVQLIDGDREAELIYKGVKKAIDIEELSLIMDIGGGSTEFIIANGNGIFWKKSYKLGAARLLEMFKPGDPIRDPEIKKLRTYLRKELSELFLEIKKREVKALIGSSGSFDTLAEMIGYRFYDPGLIEGKTHYHFSLDDFEIIFQSILYSTLEQRLKTPGLIPMRADMMVIASIFIHLVLEDGAIEKMSLSTFALKEGVISEVEENLIKDLV